MKSSSKDSLSIQPGEPGVIALDSPAMTGYSMNPSLYRVTIGPSGLQADSRHIFQLHPEIGIPEGDVFRQIGLART